MLNLVLTIASIALVVVMLLASLNYIPWWYKSAYDTEQVVRSSLVLVEQAYNVATRANNGTPPAVISGEADGGFASQFLPVLKFMPTALPDFAWSYGQSSTGTNYFCLSKISSGGSEQGIWKGVQRAAAVFSPQQYVLNTTCGATSSAAAPTSFPAPLALTYHVAYVPGVSQ